MTTTFPATDGSLRTTTTNVRPARNTSVLPFVPRRRVSASSLGPLSVIFVAFPPDAGTNLAFSLVLLSPRVPSRSSASPLKRISTKAALAVEAPLADLMVTAFFSALVNAKAVVGATASNRPNRRSRRVIRT